MNQLFLIVEGHGEVEALPVLIRKILYEHLGCMGWSILHPYRISRSKIVKFDDHLRSSILFGLEKLKEGESGGILILIDADDDCPVALSEEFKYFIDGMDAGRIISFVVANKEYESWFLASAEMMRSHSSIRNDAVRPNNSDCIRDAKGHFSREILNEGVKYAETIEQAKFSAIIDIDAASAASRSFRKFLKEVARISS